MSDVMEYVAAAGDAIASGLSIPPFPVETPCFVILEENVLSNLRATAAQSGGIGRLMPHIKTHRAPWIVRLMIEEGIRAFKAATPAEVEIAIEEGASLVVWVYPTSRGGRASPSGSRSPLSRRLAGEFGNLARRVRGGTSDQFTPADRS
jgi:hypothetical protein